MKKRVLSLLMAIAICLSMLPSAALAEIPGTGTNEVQTEQQITDEQNPDEQKPEEQIPEEQKPEEQIPEEQKPEEQKPDEQNPDKQNPDKQNPDEQKPAKAPRKAAAAETHTGDHGEYTLPEGATWQGVDSLPSDSGYYYLTQDVTIDSTWSPADGTVLCLNGYGISLNGNGPVIEVQPGVTFTLCDCNGSQNQYIHGITHASSSNGRGAGVLVGQSATTEDTARTNTAVFNMYGGAIYNNYPWEAGGENAASASGVLIGGGTFNMYGGKITGNGRTDEESLGGGVFVANQGSFLMSGGEISGNHATEGGGVFVGGSYGYHDFSASAGGTFTMSGGKITGNSGTGGGVYVSNKGTFTVSGNVNITGNKAGDKTSNNVYLGEYKGQSNTIIVNGTLDSTASIGVSVETANQVVAENISAENAEHFFRDNDKYELQYDSASQTLTLVGHDNHPICGDVTCTHGNKHDVITNWRSISTEAELNAVIMGGCYYLTQDVEIKNPWSPANGVTLCLNGHSITRNGDGNAINVTKNATFTLCDCNGSKAGNGKIIISSARYGVKIESNGTFFMYSGSISGTGTGVDVSSGSSKFNMYGGAIEGNTWHGVNNSGTFNMYGGVIKGNDRCGVYNTENTFNMYGGSIIDNKAELGGVYVENGTVNVSGDVTITGNTAKGNKTNVYLPAGKTITVGGKLDGAQIGVTTANTLAEGSYLTIAKGKDYTLTETDLNAFTSDSSYGKRLNGNSIIFTKGDLHIHALCGASCTHTGTHSEEVWKPLTYDAKTQTLYYGSVEAARSIAKGSIQNEVDGKAEIKDEMHYEYTLPSGNYYLVEDITLAGNGSIGGGAIKISSDVNLCLNGKTLSTTVKAYNVDVIGVNSQNGKCTLTLCDCDTAGRGMITSQNRTNSGVQIYGYRDGGTTTYGNLVMYGGTVKGFRNGVFVGDGTFNMFGGTITGNETGVSISSDASFTIGGTVNITVNTKNVDLGENVTITIDKSLTQDARIGITIAKEPTAGKLVWFATGANNPDLNYSAIFSCDNGSQYVVGKVETGKLFFGLHQHSWEYELSTDGKAITATCTEGGCPLENRIGGSYTITAPDNLIYDGNGKAATVTGSIPGVTEPTITYKKGDTTLGSAPTNVGKYTASITLGEGKNAKTASVEYSITQATPTYTVPTGLTAKYGQTLADISLSDGWAWEDGTQSVGSVGEHTFKATYTPGDANYHAVTGIEVTVTVNKAPVTIQIAGMPKGPIAYGDTFVLTITQTGDSNAVPKNWTKFSNDRHFAYLREQSNPEKGEFKFRAIGVCTGKGCSQKFTVEFESDTHKGSLTVSTPNVTKKTLTGEDLVFGGLTTDFTKTYDGSTSFTKASVEIRSGARVNATDALPAVNGSYVYNSKDVKDAQKVIFTSEKTESANYILPAGLVVERKAKIEPAAITVTPNAVSKTYGADDPVLTYGVSGAVNSETPAFIGALARAEGKNVGDYAINQGTLALADKDTFKAGNYKLTLATTPVNFTITKATAPTLKNITVSQKYTVTTGEKAIGTVMPADAGTLTYAKGTESKTGSVTVTNWAVDATGKVTYTLSGGAADNTVTLPVIIKSTNYVDATVNVVITLTAKDNQAALKITGGETVVYGQTLQLGTSGGSTNGAVTYTVTPGTGNATVDNATGKLTPTQVGNVTVTATMAGNAAYNDVTSASKTITITQATPTGTPIFTKITEKDKTLADAALGIGTLTPIGGKIEWVDDSDNVLPDTTKVEANKEYKWRYTPATADAVNYTTLTGTIVLYPASTGIVIYTPVNDAIFLSGANQIVAPGGAATFRINKNFGEFRSVAVDGVTLDKSNYRAWSGSTYVKLTPAYMKTLSAGTHTLAVYFTGATATTTFTISAGSSNPATGASDFAGVGAAVAMAAVSLLGAAAVLRRK